MNKINFISLLFIFYCCNGKGNSENQIINQVNNVNEMKFEERPLYQVKIKSSAVGFDVRVNDFPILQYNESHGGGTEMEIPINHAILNSGKQNLKIKVFPLLGETTLRQNGVFEIELNKKVDAWIYDKSREILLPRIVMEYDKNIPNWEYNFDFNANVPYSFEAWTNSMDLSKIENLDVLLNEAYMKLANSIESKNNNEFKELTKNASQVDVMLYEKQDASQEFQIESEKLIPMNKCKLRFYGNNKLVRYENENLESCFKTEVQLGNDEKEIYNYPFFFHMPQNSNELEVIR